MRVDKGRLPLCGNPIRPILKKRVIVKISRKSYTKIFFGLILLLIIVLSSLVILPFLKAILAGIVLSYVFYPLYSRANNKLQRKNLSSLIVSLFVVILLTLPFYFVINAVSKEAYATYIITRQKVTSGSLVVAECEVQGPVCKIVNYFEEIFKDPKVRYYLDNSIKRASTYVIDTVSGFLLSVPAFFLNSFIVIFVMFFFFRDGLVIVGKLEQLLPLKKAHQKHVFKRFDDVMFAVIYGNITIAIIQGALGGLGFFLFGLSSPILWGIVMMFFSLIPLVGSAVIWLPAAILLIFDGYIQLSNSMMLKGFLLLLWGIFVVGLMDNLLKPKIIGERAKIHPILVLIGVVGGLKAFGFIGIIIGPIILALLTAFIKIYEEER